ncbi:CIC11C00000004460 [Sungouiella intermedia]|uniref:CIC11C00000004460 n=1 Tax=Sungouiella intermedia TaxID=45354 RepID=A0A1L0C0Y9_9ASCO|nr:CIC11C00000004460 [[Candida] intermedia]
MCYLKEVSYVNEQNQQKIDIYMITNEIFRDANGRPLLRLKNVHGDLDGEDLNNLFLNIAPVDFVKFDPREETTAYVCFQLNNSENNARAIQKFDGKKAMGNTLIVENATSLADRIAPSRPQRDTVRGGRDSRPPRDDSAKEAPRVRARKPKARKPKPVKKTAEDWMQSCLLTWVRPRSQHLLSPHRIMVRWQIEQEEQVKAY